MQEQEILAELQAKIKKRRFYKTFDSWLYQTFLWLSILSSFATALFAAILVVFKDDHSIKNPMPTAISAAISALVISIDKHFSFGKRALWNCVFMSDLDALHRNVLYKIITVQECVTRLNKLDREMEANFPNIKGVNKS